MRTIALTDGGPEVSVLGFGCNNFGHNPFGGYAPYEDCEAVVHAALDAGYTLFDTADVYGDGESEEFLGRALGARRDEVLVATKFGYPITGSPDLAPGSEAYVRWAVEGALTRLGTDRIDICQMHRADLGVPVAETLGVLGDLVTEGKVRFIGGSQFAPTDLDAFADGAAAGQGPPLVSCMMYYSLLSRAPEADVIPACVRLGVKVHPYFPLESGLLTGKYGRDRTPGTGRLKDIAPGVDGEVWDAVEALQAFATERDISLVELALGGLAAMDGVGVVIVGASRPDQVAANAAAVAWAPTVDELELLRGLPWRSPAL